MVTAGAMFTENIYKPLIRKNAPDRHYTLVGRIASALLVASGILFAYSLESMVSALELFWMIAALMGVPFFVGLFWRGATAAGTWAATIVSFLALAFTGKIPIGSHVLWDFNARFADSLPQFMVFDGKLYLPWQMIIYLVAGFITLVVVSLFTKRTPAERLDRFYQCLRTPVHRGEPAETAPFTLRRVLFKHPDFEIPIPTPLSVIGFLLSWAAVAALIAFVYWILS
jgi:Na+/proline symporter